MEPSSWILLTTAAGIGLVHTVIGVDHTLPFAVLARSQAWSLRKLWGVTAVCGLAHVLSSVLLGTLGIGAGIALERLTDLESSRGGVAAWLLVFFGLAYASWGFYRARGGRVHAHRHLHEDGTSHSHAHDHLSSHVHVHAKGGARTMTLMGLLIVFVLGPCEPLIPLLAPAAFARDWVSVVAVVVAFGAATIVAMITLVTIAWWGFQRWRALEQIERHVHTLAGLAIAASGLAITLLGL